MTIVHTRLGLLVAATLGCAGTAHADSIINGGFETGDFTGWSTTGITVTSYTAVPPPSGNYQAALGTSRPTEAASSASAMAAVLGVTVGDISGVITGQGPAKNQDGTFYAASSSTTVFSGSAIAQTVNNINAGDTLSFDWHFLSFDWAESWWNDTAFFTITNLTTNTTEVIHLADTFSGLVASPTTAFAYELAAGYQSFEYIFGAGGDYRIGFGVINVGDDTFQSGLLLDNISITAIPLPAPAWIGLAGLAGVVVMHRRRV